MQYRFLFVSFVSVLCVPVWAQKDLGRILPDKLPADHPLHLVALGDFGSGNSHQEAVAHAMAQREKQKPFDLGISLGDNFYRCGVHGVNDHKWETRWEELYTPLGIPFYASLGNHDYGHPPIICPGGGASPSAEVAFTADSESWRMPARYYTYIAGPVRFFAIDTEGWKPAELTWLTQELERTDGETGVSWRIVYGHHPMFTSGVHLNERRIGALRRELLPLFEQYHVDLYIAGHDHDMEHLRTNGIDFLICGAGGAHLRSFHNLQPESLFHDKTYGFLDLEITEHSLEAQFLDTDLNSLENPPLMRMK